MILELYPESAVKNGSYSRKKKEIENREDRKKEWASYANARNQIVEAKEKSGMRNRLLRDSDAFTESKRKIKYKLFITRCEELKAEVVAVHHNPP